MRPPDAPKQCISVAICVSKSSQKLSFASALTGRRSRKLPFANGSAYPKVSGHQQAPRRGLKRYPQVIHRLSPLFTSYPQVIHRYSRRLYPTFTQVMPMPTMPLGYTGAGRRCPQGMQRGGVRVSNVDRREARAATAYD